MGTRRTQPRATAPLSARARKQLVDSRIKALDDALAFIDYALRGTRSPSMLASAHELLRRMARAIVANERDGTITVATETPRRKRATTARD